VFSPYYARARAKGPADPENHVALNVALYGRSHRRWTMTERGRRTLSRDATQLRIGPSAVRRDGDDVIFEIDEIGTPVPLRVRGTVRVRPKIHAGPVFALDAGSAHRWRPLAPLAEIEVDLPLPGISWRGEGYLDTNWGDTPLESAFKQWHWARAATGDGARIVYSVERRDGTQHAIAAAFDAAGAHEFPPPPETKLPRTWWGIARPACADPGAPARVIETLEDTPFYARSTIDSTWNGAHVRAMHESLSLDRFASRWVRALLPFRMPRLRG
jgi:carotenoid 1,2-hydratase